MSAASQESSTLPDHVPQELVAELPFGRGLFTTDLPHDIIARLHQAPEVFFAPNGPAVGGTWVVRRVEHCREVSLDTEHFSNRDYTPFPQMTGGHWKMIPAEIDPPLHAHYRNILNPLLSPKAITALDTKMADFAREDVSAFKARGHCEFMADFAFGFPIRIFLEMMGLPTEETTTFLKWERGMIYGSTLEEVQAAAQLVIDYLTSEIAARRDASGDDFIGHVLRAKVDDRKLDDNEMLGICFNLFIGGLDTVSTTLGHLVRHLSEHQDQQAYLRANRTEIPQAVEELIRAYGVTGNVRECIKDTTIGGVTIKCGDRVFISQALAGRDPTEYSEPNEVRFDRKPRHVSFGYGPHLCIGMHLARRELHVAIGTMFDLLPPFRIAPGAEIVTEMAGMIQARTLPLVWDV